MANAAAGLHGGLAAAAAWPVVARGQQGSRIRRIGVLMQLAADDPEGQTRRAAFLQGLQQANWAIGRNVRTDYRWAAGDANQFRRYAAELVALAPDVILASTNQSVSALQQETRTIPIVFVAVVEPVGAGLVDNLARPGGNTTGFEVYQFSFGGKWLELLKQIAPSVRRVAEDTTAGNVQLGALGSMQSAAPSFGMELSPFDIRDAHAAALPSPAMNCRRLIIQSPRRRAEGSTAARRVRAPWRS
jgi:putative tryptophan/tyrosine transport system substrate-binding protein